MLAFTLLTLIPSAFAYVSFTVPAAGASVPATGFTITWVDSGTPAIADLTAYTLYLYAGTNTAPVAIGPALASGTTPTPESLTADVAVTLGGNTTNA